MVRCRWTHHDSPHPRLHRRPGRLAARPGRRLRRHAVHAERPRLGARHRHVAVRRARLCPARLDAPADPPALLHRHHHRPAAVRHQRAGAADLQPPLDPPVVRASGDGQRSRRHQPLAAGRRLPRRPGRRRRPAAAVEQGQRQVRLEGHRQPAASSAARRPATAGRCRERLHPRSLVGRLPHRPQRRVAVAGRCGRDGAIRQRRRAVRGARVLAAGGRAGAGGGGALLRRRDGRRRHVRRLRRHPQPDVLPG